MVRRYGGRTYVITYNGELYNMPELRRELRRGTRADLPFRYRVDFGRLCRVGKTAPGISTDLRLCHLG